MNAVFVYADWAAMYPELALWVSSATAQQWFNQATLFLDNTPCSPVRDVGIRTNLLYMLTSHLLALTQPINGQPSSPLVGRISDASEGSVNVRTEMNYAPGSAQWYMQTKYGAMYWTATSQYKLARYVPGPQRNFNAGIPIGSGIMRGFMQ